jgi:hypothetical protein
MKKQGISSIILIAFVTVVFAATGFAKDDPVDSQWAAAPASIDGMNTEWGNIPMNQYKKTKVEYAFMNGQDNLFILFIFKDPKYLSSINWTGLTVWLNDEGKKKKDLGIRFVRKEITADDYIAILEKQAGQQMPEERKNQIRQNKNYVLFDQELINKKAENYDEDAEKPKFQDAAFRLGQTEKGIIFEFSISYLKLAELGVGFGAEPGDMIRVGFEWGGATKEMKEAIASRMAAQNTRARPEGATGGLESERRVSSGSGSLEAMRRSMPKKYNFWVEVKLAPNQ